MRRLEIYLFAFAWLTYAYFCQGGGWNQNGRFALTRAIVESRELTIDNYLVYASNGPKGSPGLRRVPVENGGFTDAGRKFALAWWIGDERVPLAPDTSKDARLAVVDWAAVSGDLAYARGHVHPNKAPGASFLAVPAYALIFAIERGFSVDPDGAIVMSVNGWLTSALSVGLLSALGVVVFFRLALAMADGNQGPALFAAAAFAFGTLYFPYATMLYEHDLVAFFLIAAFALSFNESTNRRLFAAGICSGLAVMTSYLAAIGVAIVGAYVAWKKRRLAPLAAFAAGAIPPLALLAAYNAACFGKVLTTNYAWENPLFKQGDDRVLSVFTAPQLDVLLALLVSPFRGLFTLTPVLVLGSIGLVAMLRTPRFRAEGLVCAAMVAHLLAFNMSFTNWNGGWGCGPRYLIPAIPFLALPIAHPAARPKWIAGVLLSLSIAGMALVTVVDPQPPATTETTWAASPIWTIDLPQFLNGKPGGYASSTWPVEFLAQHVGTVSTNFGGIYEGTAGRFFGVGTPQARWSSFNAGEVVFPDGRLSVLPWLALAGAFAAVCSSALRRRNL